MKNGMQEREKNPCNIVLIVSRHYYYGVAGFAAAILILDSGAGWMLVKVVGVNKWLEMDGWECHSSKSWRSEYCATVPKYAQQFRPRVELRCPSF